MYKRQQVTVPHSTVDTEIRYIRSSNSGSCIERIMVADSTVYNVELSYVRSNNGG